VQLKVMLYMRLRSCDKTGLGRTKTGVGPGLGLVSFDLGLGGRSVLVLRIWSCSNNCLFNLVTN